MVAIMAAEAAGIVHVSDVIRVRAPGYFHVWKTVGGENGDQSLSRRFDEIGMCGEDIRMLVAIELRELSRNLDSRFIFGSVIGFEQLESLFVDPGKLGADGAFRHGAIERVFSGLHGVCGAIVAVNAVHYATLALRLSTLQAGIGEGCLGPVRIGALRGGNSVSFSIERDVLDVA